MALFKIFRGPENELNTVPCHEGYAYFTEDTGNLFIDIASTPGSRVQVNARLADSLKAVVDGTVREFDVDDFILKTATIMVNNGGTGRQTLTLNAILLGNGTGQVKMVTVEEGAIILGGDATEGLKGLKGTGALYAATDGAPQFGTLPLTAGGTGGTTAEQARENLEVYSSETVDRKVGEVTTLAYEYTITVDSWLEDSSTGKFTSTYAQANLKCGKNGDVPPTITWVTNLEDYSNIDSAEATKGSGITFTTSKKPKADIKVIIIDKG